MGFVTRFRAPTRKSHRVETISKGVRALVASRVCSGPGSVERKCAATPDEDEVALPQPAIPGTAVQSDDIEKVESLAIEEIDQLRNTRLWALTKE